MRDADAVKLLEFIEASKSKGASDEFLASFLARRGWPQQDVYSALGKYWERATGLPVPERISGGESSRDAFLYLLSFSTLATWSSALGSILFRFIESWFPDPVVRNHVYNLRNAVTWQMASVAVAFPIFLIVMRIILREADDPPERLESGVRKWLTYLVLLLTAGAMICDLIWFFDYFLTGELSARFVLKALTVMLVCGAIFVYYLGSLRWDRNTNMAHAKARSLKFGIGAAAVLVASFCVGLGMAGTPSVQRHLEADHRRVENLRGIAFAVNSWYRGAESGRSSERLPRTLSELVGKGVDASQIADPETRITYGYRVKSGTAYELCARFSGTEEEDGPYQTQFWHHEKGRACFTLDASQQPAW
jgi:uncharacterized membrane protein YidH (DUF202 family)